MKFYDFLNKQIRVKSIKDLLFLLFKLAIIYFFVIEVYDDLRFLSCYAKISEARPLFYFAIVKRLIIISIIVFLYRLVKYFKKKGRLAAAIKYFVALSIITWLINGSILGVYFWDGPYWGRVIDADSGEPIAGAVVAGMWDFEYYLFIHGGSTYADTRETVTDEKGRFFLQPARTIWLWPFSRIVLSKLNVLKPGYDSHPPRMQRAWTDEDKQKWLKELNLRYPEYRQKYSQTYHSIEAQEYFSNPRYAPAIYHSIFRVKYKVYRPSIIILNKARSSEEQYKAAIVPFGDVPGCDRFKIEKMVDVVNRERKRFGLKGRY